MIFNDRGPYTTEILCRTRTTQRIIKFGEIVSYRRRGGEKRLDTGKTLIPTKGFSSGKRIREH